MECYCDFDIRADLYLKTDHVAKKTHRCSECGREIAPGERYERVFGVWEGRADVFKTCGHCLAMREFVSVHVPCFCWSHGDMRSEAIEVAMNHATETSGLLFGTLRREALIRHARENSSELA